MIHDRTAKGLGFVALVLPFLLATPALAESRGLTVELRTAPEATAPVAERVELYDHSYALVIGNDAYAGGWPKLSNAVADATEIAAALKKAGFEVTLKTDLDSSALGASLKEFFAVQGADPEARLLLWYAGHGHSIKDEGFLVPVDAPAPSEPEFKIRALQMRDFGGLMRLAEAKHVLAIFDSCFSGTIFTTRAGAAPAAITQITTQPTRQFITSGDAAQQVSDDGIFRRLFLQALAGESTADSNGDGYLTGTELGLYMYDEMANYSEGAQTPRYGKLRDPDYDRGDFVFAVAGRTEAPLDDFGSDVVQNEPAASAEDMIIEITLWTTVVGSQDPVMVQTYLDAYPTGRFAKAAIARIADLKKQIADKEADAAAEAAAKAERESADAVVASVPELPQLGEVTQPLPSVAGRKVDTRPIAGDAREMGWVYINNCGMSEAAVTRIRKAINGHHFGALRLVPGRIANFDANRPECAEGSSLRTYANAERGASAGLADRAADELAAVLQTQQVFLLVAGGINVGDIADRYRFDIWLSP